MGMKLAMTHTCVCDTDVTCVEASLPPDAAAWAWPGSSARPSWRPLEACALSPSSRMVPGELAVRLTREHPLHSRQKFEPGGGDVEERFCPSVLCHCCAV